jgi:hypothetical protein
MNNKKMAHEMSSDAKCVAMQVEFSIIKSEKNEQLFLRFSVGQFPRKKFLIYDAI